MGLQLAKYHYHLKIKEVQIQLLTTVVKAQFLFSIESALHASLHTKCKQYQLHYQNLFDGVAWNIC